PLMTEISAASARCGVTPGYSSVSVDSTTPVSPSAGSTCPMYRRNVAFGPTMSTPRFSSCRRCVYSRKAARCSATAVLPVPGPPGRAPPVEQQRLVVRGFVPDAHPPDIPPLVAGQVQAAEAQPVFRRVQLGDPGAEHAGRHVALGPGRRGAAGFPQRPGQPDGG